LAEAVYDSGFSAVESDQLNLLTELHLFYLFRRLASYFARSEHLTFACKENDSFDEFFIKIEIKGGYIISIFQANALALTFHCTKFAEHLVADRLAARLFKLPDPHLQSLQNISTRCAHGYVCKLEGKSRRLVCGEIGPV